MKQISSEQKSYQCPHPRVPPHHRGLPGVLHHDATGSRLEVDDAVDAGRPELPGVDGGAGPWPLSLFQHAPHHLLRQVIGILRIVVYLLRQFDKIAFIRKKCCQWLWAYQY